VRHKRDKTDIITLDITRKDLLKSGYYYLKPNDLVYIDPLKSKQFAFETFPYGMAFSTISFVLALYTLLR
jgi:polysaccharide export outer membrane protein